MYFKDLQPNTPFFVIDNNGEDFNVYPATLLTVSQPRFENSTQQFSQKVIDLNVSYNGKKVTYTTNETAENIVFAQNGTTLILDQNTLIAQLKSLKLGCENTIKEAKTAETKLGKIEKSLEEYDVSFKEKKEYDEKISSLSSKLDKLADNFSKFLETYNSKNN